MIAKSIMPHADIWHYLAESYRPIYVYGMGDGGDKMLRAMERYGIRCAGFFASDGFVRGQVFHGERVMAFSEVAEKHGGDFIALMAFGSKRPDVIEYVTKIAQKCEFYIPELPVVGENLFDAEFYSTHKSEFDAARSLFADDLSREVFDEVIAYRIDGRIEHLLAPSMSTTEEDALREIGCESFTDCLDLGAYTGDTVKILIAIQRELGRVNLKRITALEPERHSHKKLESYLASLESETGIVCRAYNACAGDFCGRVEFSGGRGRGSRASSVGKTTSVESLCADAIEGISPDYIKYDVEGAEYAALIGSRRLIEQGRPTLNIALYHRPEDLYKLPILVHEICADYRLLLRRHGGLPGWDLNLYAVV